MSRHSHELLPFLPKGKTALSDCRMEEKENVSSHFSPMMTGPVGKVHHRPEPLPD
jgi:hypothetical protein